MEKGGKKRVRRVVIITTENNCVRALDAFTYMASCVHLPRYFSFLKRVICEHGCLLVINRVYRTRGRKNAKLGESFEGLIRSVVFVEVGLASRKALHLL